MNVQDQIQVYDEDIADVYSIVNKIVNSGKQNVGFFVCDVSEIVSRCSKWKQLFSNINIFYDVKCNDSRIVLETLVALAVGFSCGSKEDIRKVISLGASPNRIIFSNATKKSSHIIYAAYTGVKYLSFDNEEELYKIKKLYPSAELIIKIYTEEPSDNPLLARKYGALPGEDSRRLLSIAKSLGLNVVGASFYLKFFEDNDKEYEKAIKITETIFSIASEVGFNFKVVSIGGEYSGGNETLIKNIAEVVNKSLAKYFPNEETKFMAESGPYFVESAFKLVTHVHSKRILPDKTRMYYLDSGVYNGLAGSLLKKIVNRRKLLKVTSSSLYPSLLWGPTCDSIDKVSKDVEYFPEISVGEWIIFEDNGAYSLPISYEFNGINIPKIHNVVTKKNWIMLTEKAPVPMSKTKFLCGDSLDNCMIGLDTPYIFEPFYF